MSLSAAAGADGRFRDLVYRDFGLSHHVSSFSSQHRLPACIFCLGLCRVLSGICLEVIDAGALESNCSTIHTFLALLLAIHLKVRCPKN